MKINSLHLRLIHAWMCTKDHKCKCKQVWIDTFLHQEPALIQDSKVYSLYLYVDSRNEKNSGGKAHWKQICYKFMSVLALFVQHILEQHTSILQNEMERDCDLGRSSSVCHPNHCNLWVYIWFIFVYVLNSAFNNCPRHMDKRGWSIFYYP